jgi:hypothetical protein
MLLSSPSTAIEVPTRFLIIKELQFKQVFVGKEYQAAQDKMADNKFSITKTNSPLSDISQIPAPESRPTDGLRNSLKVTEWDVDDEFPPIQVLLVRLTKVIDLTGENPPLGQPEL